jgi:hypothetical protein
MVHPAGPAGQYRLPGETTGGSQPAEVRAELLAVRRAVEEAQRHVRTLRAHPVNTRLTGRLEADVRRVGEVVEDLEDLAGETLPAGADRTDRQRRRRRAQDGVEDAPVPVPSRWGEPEFTPERDDEGVGGGWQDATSRHGSGRRRRRATP